MAVAVGAIEIPQRRQGVLGVPIGGAGAHDVARGLIDGKGGIEGEVQFQQFLDHRLVFRAAFFARLRPQASGLAEAMLLVEIVVARGIVLHRLAVEQRLGQAVPVLHRGQAPARGGQHIDPRHIELGVMAGAAHALLLQLDKRGFEDVGPIAEALHAERALDLHRPHPGAGLVWRRHRRVAFGAEEHIREDSGRGDLVALTAFRFRNAEVDAVAATRVAHCGDAVSQPQLVDVLGRYALILAADMTVQVDKTGEDVMPGEIDLVSPRFQRGPIGGLDRRVGVADDLYLDDAIALDHDIRRSEGRAAGAIDHSHAAQDQLRPRTLAFGARRGNVYGRRAARNRNDLNGSEKAEGYQWTHGFPGSTTRADNDRMKHWLAASIAALLGVASGPSPRAANLLVYRCIGAEGAVSLQDTPCPHGQDQETRTLAKPIAVPQSPRAPAPPTPPPVDAPAPPPDVRVELVDPQPLYDCQRHDGSRYESDTGVPERYWVPLWVLGMDPRAPPQTFGPVGKPKPAPPARGPGLRTATSDPAQAYGAGAWVEDRCYRLPASLACARRQERLSLLGRRIFNAQQTERDRLRIEQRGLREQLRQECGIG